jgi:hypothetical protein
MDRNKMQSILPVLTDAVTAAAIQDECRSVAELVKALPPTLSEASVKTKLREMSDRELHWANDDDKQLKSDLDGLANDINRMRRLKNGGVEQFQGNQPVYDGLRSIITKCHSIGLFLVPVGELEYWSPELGVTASKSKKAEWANEAAMLLRTNADRANDLLGFMETLGKFHAAEANRLA